MKVLPVILGIIPGIGHISLGRCFKGVLIFFFFAVFVNLILIGRLVLWLDGGEALIQTGVGCALLIWVYSFLDVVKIALWNKRPWIGKLKKQLFSEGIKHYLREELDKSRRQFQRILRLDDEDVDAHFLLGVVLRRLGNERRARRCFKRALALDETRKWDWEVSEHLKEMQR